MAAARRKWVIILPVLIGIAALFFLKRNQQPPVQEPPEEKARLVRVIPAPSVTVIPRAQGFGTVRPAHTWEAVAQVKGEIIDKHPELERGAILPAGTDLLRIDPADYELAIAEARAALEATKAQLQELENKISNTRASLKIEQAALALNRKELERKRKLVGKGGVSRSDLESQERALLAQQQSVQAQKNTLNLFPSQRALLEAQLKRDQAKLKSAQRSLEHTRIRLPFTGRIAAVNVERNQYVREGEVLVKADGLKLAEVEAQISLEEMGYLIRSDKVVDALKATPGEVRKQMRLNAEVLLREGNLTGRWQARFSRLSDTLDPKTRTVGVIVEVDDPYTNIQPGVRPPLLKGLFVEVVLGGQPQPESLVVPRLSLHDGKLYLIDQEDRLQIRTVKVGLVQPDFVVIEQGLKPGERVVISDLIPAVEGMLLKPKPDEAALKRLLQAVETGDPRS